LCYLILAKDILLQYFSCVPLGNSWRTPRGTRTAGWKPLAWNME